MHSLRTTLSRKIGSLSLSLVVTASLLLLMQHLIKEEGGELEAAPGNGTLAFLPDLEESTPDTKERNKPKKIEPPVTPPDTFIKHTLTPAVEGVGMAIKTPTGGTEIGPVLGQGLPDGDILPITKVSPMYPERARRQGIEGYVVVQFTVDELGRVVDVQVLEAVPSSVFNRSAIDAVQRFKYKPRVVNGAPMVVTGVKHRLTFELS